MAKTPKEKDTKEDNVKLIKKEANKLLKLMGTSAKAKVDKDKDNEAIVVNIETEEEAGLLIGNRGDTLNSIQTILSLIVRQKTGDWQRIVVNLSDWRERQEERLSELALQAASRAKESGEDQTLYNLNAAQRRIVHIVLAEDDEIETESQGEGAERFLVIHPK